MSEEIKPEEQSKKPVEPIQKKYFKHKRDKLKDKPIKETKPQEQPKKDEKIESIDDAIKKQHERFKDKDGKKPEGDPTIIQTSVLDGIKKGIEDLPFTGYGGMWKATTLAYASCTDEYGHLTTPIDELEKRVNLARKNYFKSNYGEWKEGKLKDMGETLGDRVYKQYLGDTEKIFKQLGELPKEKITPKIVMSRVLEPLTEYFEKQIGALDEDRIRVLGKNEKEKLKDELVYKSQQLGRPLTKAELLSDDSLLKAVYGIIGEGERREYESKIKDKPLFEGLA